MKRDTNVNLNNPRVYIEGGIIASVYVVLALVFAPISFGPIQLRIAEALTALPLRRGSAVSGLFVGCFIANSLGPNGMMDAVIGSGLTLIAAVITYCLRKKNFFVAMLAPVVINAVGIGLMIKYIYADTLSLYLIIAYIAGGQILACMGLGYLFIKAYDKADEQMLKY